MTTYPFDLESVNYDAVWDSLRLAGKDRTTARIIIRAYQADPDLRNSAAKTRTDLEDIAKGASGSQREQPRSVVVEALIDAEVLIRGTPNGHPVYRLNSQVLKKLERKY
jgi:hypothetical protein